MQAVLHIPRFPLSTHSIRIPTTRYIYTRPARTRLSFAPSLISPITLDKYILSPFSCPDPEYCRRHQSGIQSDRLVLAIKSDFIAAETSFCGAEHSQGHPSPSGVNTFQAFLRYSPVHCLIVLIRQYDNMVWSTSTRGKGGGEQVQQYQIPTSASTCNGYTHTV